MGYIEDNIKSYKNNRMLRDLLCFVSIINMACMVLVISIYTIATYFLTDLTRSLNNERIVQAQQLIDTKLLLVEELVANTKKNKYIQEMSLQEALDTPKEIYQVSQLIKMMKLYKDKSNIIKECYIYLTNSDTIISSEGKYNALFFYDAVLKKDARAFDTWKSEIVQTLSMDGFYREKIVTDDYRTLDAYLVIEYDMNKIKETLMLQNRFEGSALLIKDEENTLVREGNTALVQMLDEKWETFKLGENIVDVKESGNVIVNKQNSTMSKWKYYIAISEAEYFRKLDFVSAIIQVMLGLEIVLSMLIVIVYIRRISYKLTDVINRMNKSDMTELKNNNYLGDIENLIQDIHHQNKELYKKQKKMQLMLSNQFMVDLLRDEQEEKEYHQYMSNKEFMYEAYCIVKVEVQKESVLFNLKDRKALSKMVVENIISECITERYKCIFVNVDCTSIVMLIENRESRTPESEVLQDEIAKIIGNCQAIIKDKFNIELGIGISQTSSGTENAKLLYQEASKALEYRILYGKEHIGIYKKAAVGGEAIYTLEKELEIIRASERGDAKQVRELLDSIFHSKHIRDVEYIEVVKILMDKMNETISCIKKKVAWNELGGGVKYSTLEDFERYTYDFYEKLCGHIKGVLDEQKREKHDALKDRIIEKIHQNYMHTEICLNGVADEFGLTPTYLSSMFKQYTGENFSNYIVRLRINKAKKLLLETNMSMQEIAETIGYANSGVFIKVFKRVEYITPGKYREEHSKISS